MEQSKETRRIEKEREKFVAAVRESRVFWRRQLAHDLTVSMLSKDEGGQREFANPAAFVEDFANAVAERLWAREDKEITDGVI